MRLDSTKTRRYGRTFARHDIAFEFSMWISPKFVVYLIREYQRLKLREQQLIGWNLKDND